MEISSLSQRPRSICLHRALQKGMEQKAVEFVGSGAEVYRKA